MPRPDGLWMVEFQDGPFGGYEANWRDCEYHRSCGAYTSSDSLSSHLARLLRTLEVISTDRLTYSQLIDPAKPQLPPPHAHICSSLCYRIFVWLLP